MAQMARFGFLTVGNCSGHQVTGAQLAVLVAGVGVGVKKSWGEKFLLGADREYPGPKEVLCYCGHPLPRVGLYLLPLLCLPALVARADLPGPACCSLPPALRMGATWASSASAPVWALCLEFRPAAQRVFKSF